MTTPRFLASLFALALLVGALPAGADDAALPAACNGESPVLAEGETLVEHTLYLHATTRVGTVDQAQEFATASISGKTFMNTTAPAGSDHKVTPIVTGTNSNFNGNWNMAYWKGTIPEGTRIVCAGTTFYAAAQGAITAKLFVDKAWADVTPDANRPATATGADNVRLFTANFGKTELEVFDNAVLQLAPGGAGAVLFDSTDYASKFTYITIAPPPPPTP